MTRPDMPKQLPADLRAAFGQLGKEAAGEFRPTPLARLMAAHLPLFVELHRRGASWAQTTEFLTAYGITGAKGPFGASVVRATYSRVCAAAANIGQRNNAQPAETNRNPAKQTDSVRHADGREGHDPVPNGPERSSADRNAAQRNAADGDNAERNETESALHRRAELLNRGSRRR